MPLEQLLQALEAETEAAAREVLDQAERSARARIEAAETAAQQQVTASQEREESAWREAVERDLAACRREGRLQWLRARETFLNRIFALAAGRMPAAAAGPDYAAGIPAELDLALPYLGDAAGVVHCPPAQVSVAGAYLAGRPGILLEPDLPAGLRIVACDGSVEVDRTLTQRMESLRPSLSIALMRELES